MRASKYTLDLIMIAICLIAIAFISRSCNNIKPDPAPNTVYVKGKPDTVYVKGDSITIEREVPKPYLVFVDSSAKHDDSTRMYKNDLSGSFGDLYVTSKVDGVLVDQKVDFIPNITVINTVDTMFIPKQERKFNIGVILMPTIDMNKQLDVKIGPSISAGKVSYIGTYGFRRKEIGVGLIYNF